MSHTQIGVQVMGGGGECNSVLSRQTLQNSPVKPTTQIGVTTKRIKVRSSSCVCIGMTNACQLNGALIHFLYVKNCLKLHFIYLLKENQ